MRAAGSERSRRAEAARVRATRGSGSPLETAAVGSAAGARPRRSSGRPPASFGLPPFRPRGAAAVDRG